MLNFIRSRTDKEYQQIVRKTKLFLLNMTEWSMFKESAEYLSKNMTESDINSLSYLINHQE